MIDLEAVVPFVEENKVKETEILLRQAKKVHQAFHYAYHSGIKWGKEENEILGKLIAKVEELETKLSEAEWENRQIQYELTGE
jgi:hypothetical protein